MTEKIEKKALITWEPSRYSGYRGFAGGIELFTMSWHSRQEDPKFLLRSQLTGLYLDAKDDDPEVLKAKAEDALAAWLDQVGGTTP